MGGSQPAQYAAAALPFAYFLPYSLELAPGRRGEGSAALNCLRGIETRTLTDAAIFENGLLCGRTKRSSTHVTLWTPRLRQVVDQSSLCTAVHPLYTRFVNILGAFMSEATMRPHPRLGADRGLLPGERLLQGGPARFGLGRIVALCHRSSTAYQICYHIQYLCF